MTGLCIRDLTRITRGTLRLGLMPPLGGDLDPVGRIVIDSRQVQPGDVFWGLTGRYHDGAHFAEEAFARGASGVVVAGRQVEPWAGKFTVQVEDSNWALWQLARAIRRRFAGRLIVATGHGTQATLREMLHATLGVRLTGAAHSIDPRERTALPYALLNLRNDHDYVVLELPPDENGEIHVQSTLCDPQIAVINCPANGPSPTAVDELPLGRDQHEILNALPREGSAILHGTTPRRRELKNLKAKLVWTGRGSDADVMARDVSLQQGGLRFTIDETKFYVPNAGRHDLAAALACFAVGRAMELTPQEIAEGLKRFPGVAGRCAVTQHDHFTVIDDLADATWHTTIEALEFMKDLATAGQRYFVCGDLAEPHADADTLAQRLGETVVTAGGADWLFACGERAEKTIAAARAAGMPHGRAIPLASPQEAADLLQNVIEQGDVVLIKGKQTQELQTIVASLTEKNLQRRVA